MSEFAPGLWVGGVEEAFDLNLLASARITAVLNVATELEFAGRVGLEYNKLGIEDDSRIDDLRDILPDAMKLLRDEVMVRGGVVMVHCLEGRSRSVCVALAFMVTELRCGSFDACLDRARECRPAIDPWPAFLLQTRSFCEHELRTDAR